MNVIHRLSVSGVIFVGSVLVTAAWTNTLLHITRHSTDMVLDAAELEAFAPTPTNPSDDAPIEEQSVDLASSPPESEVSDTERNSLASRPEEHPAFENKLDEAEPLHLPSDPVASSSSADDTTVDRLFRPGEEGSVASFLGNAPFADPEDVSTGNGSGITWSIRFSGSEDLEQIGRVRAFRVVALRSTHENYEVALVQGRQVNRPIAVASFLQQHPGFAAGQGVVLERRLLESVQERLLTYGSGWRLWLLVEDALFSRWTASVEAALSARQVSWNDVKRIEATVRASAQGSEPVFSLDRIVEKPDGPPVTNTIEAANFDRRVAGQDNFEANE